MKMPFSRVIEEKNYSIKSKRNESGTKPDTPNPKTGVGIDQHT
ncbi:hypothetical protein [Pleomorphovibrio marinus]|nr:hypothetical protein [Pleomorphovibrio marinus]